MRNVADHPTDALGWFRFARQQRRRQLEAGLQVGEWASQISHLVHMLQRERGASNIWLCSGGQLFVREVPFCIAQSDEQIAALRQRLALPDPIVNAAIAGRLACALWYLDALPALRSRIQARSIEPEAAMAQFSQSIGHLLSIVPEANDTLDDANLARALTALYSFMQGKELAGQERAIGAMGFTRGDFSDPLRQMLVDRIDGQQRCFGTFIALAAPELAAEFREQGEASREMEQLRRLACTRLPPDEETAGLAVRWFALQTQRLDKLRETEERLIAVLQQAAQAQLHQETENNEPDEAAFSRWVQDHACQEEPAALDRHLLPLVRQQARQLETLTRQLASLQETLEERKVIDKAKSLLIRHQQLSEEQAWQQLRKLAMDQNKRMVEIARAMLSVADLWSITPKE